ncbi:MAG: potassium channel family protein [Paracoccaceae bacterium]
MKGIKTFTLLGMLVMVVLAGTVFFRFTEGWSWLDSYFFTVVTLSTVGYGSLVPETVAGKIGTTIFIFVGLGIFAVVIQQFGAYAVRKRAEHTERLVDALTRTDRQHPPAEMDDDAPPATPEHRPPPGS